MASRTEYLPDEITYGFVADRVLLATRDTNSDDDRFPDGVPAQGTVRFSPERRILYTQQQPATVLPQDIECTIYHREHPVVKERSYEPEHVGELVDPTGHIGNVALIVGWYEVVYNLSDGTAKNFRFEVKPEHTEDNPLWLPSVAPLEPTPSERFVVNEQVYADTKQARDETVAARDLVLPARDQTLAARDQTLALGITVDTSVGTRVFVGDTMIYGDTGWRDISDTLVSPATIVSGGLALIRRIDSVVHIKIAGIHLEQFNGDTNLLPIPTGFRQFEPRQVLHSGSTDTQPESFLLSSSLWFLRYRGAIDELSSSYDYSLNLNFVTDQNWPTSLPGVPS